MREYPAPQVRERSSYALNKLQDPFAMMRQNTYDTLSMDQQFSKELELEHQPSQDKMLRLKKSPNGKEMKRPQSAPLPGPP